MKLLKIFKTFVLVAAVLALCGASCTKPDSKTELSLKVESETVSAKSSQIFVSVKCNSSWTIALTDDSDGSAVDWARLNAGSGSGDRNLIMTIDANPDESRSRKVRITVSCSNISESVAVEQAAAGKHDVNDPDPGPEPEPDNGPDLSKTGWMELPAMDNPDLGYYSHSFKMGGKSYRNYSFGWSQKDRVALWVAYPLNKMYTAKNVQRTDEWAYDPLLGTDSSAPFSYYGRKTPTDRGNDPYARGHQIPSADRLCNREANVQTFYGTNMTPQLNAHNEKIWSDLESKVRGYANSSDTTYVVTGVMVSSSSEIQKDSYGNNVTVPDSYFKAILKYSPYSTLGTWNAAAFYLEHRAYSGSISKEHSMSIDELEEMTGIDFFVNLPAKIGEDQAAKLEAADPANSSVWW
jgi:endonuclease G